MGSTSQLIASDGQTQITATIAEDASANDPVTLTPNGIFKSLTYANTLTTIGSDDYFSNHCAMNGDGDVLCAIFRDTSAVKVAAYSVNATSGELTLINQANFTITATNNGGYVRVFWAENDEFIIVYQETNGDAYDARVVTVDVGGSSVSLGTALNINSGSSALRDFAQNQTDNNVYYLQSPGASAIMKRIDKSGTTLSETSLTVPSNFPVSGTVADFKIGWVNGVLITVFNDPTGSVDKINAATLSGTTISSDDTESNDYAITTSDYHNVRIIPKGQSTGDFLIMAKAGGDTKVNLTGVVVTTPSGVGTLSVNGTPREMTAGTLNVNFWDGVYNVDKSLYMLCAEEDGSIKFYPVTQANGSNALTVGSQTQAIALGGDTISGSGADNERSNVGFAYTDAGNGFGYLSVGNQTDATGEIYKVTDVQKSVRIGIIKEDVTAGNSSVIALRNTIGGALSENHSGLTRAQNYYLGDSGLSTTETDQPFFGYAIDTDKIIASETAI